jgi:hypothetical protein
MKMLQEQKNSEIKRENPHSKKVLSYKLGRDIKKL